MQEEVNQKTVVLVFQTARFTGNVLKKGIQMYLNHRKAKAASVEARIKAKEREPTHGKMTVEELVGQGQGATTIEIKDRDIKDFERIARKYNVDFAVKQDLTQKPPKYLVFFKAKDTDVISQAFKEYVHAASKKRQRPSLQAKLTRLKQFVALNKDKLLAREKNHDRGAPSL